MAGVRMLRQHYQYEMLSSRAYRTVVITTLKRDNKRRGLFLLPVHGIVEDMDVKGPTGSSLTVLTAGEAKAEFDVDVRGIRKTSKSRYEQDLELVPVLLDPSDSEYTKITFTYTTYVSPSSFDDKTPSPNMKIEFPFKIVPEEFILPDAFIGPHGKHTAIVPGPFNVYVLFKTGEDYKISQNPSTGVETKVGQLVGKVDEIHTDDHHDGKAIKKHTGDHLANNKAIISVYPDGHSKVRPTEDSAEYATGFFIEGLMFDEVVVGSVEVGLSDSLRNTAVSITVISFLIPVMLLGAQFFSGRLLDSALEILGLSVALLIGERVLVLKDRYLMSKWRRIHGWLLGLNAAAFLAWLTAWGIYGQ